MMVEQANDGYDVTTDFGGPLIRRRPLPAACLAGPDSAPACFFFFVDSTTAHIRYNMDPMSDLVNVICWRKGGK